MSTANKLTYLNTTKGKIKDSINLTGANITNDTTFRNYAVALRDKLAEGIGDISSFKNVLIDNFPKVEETGTSLSFSAYNTWFNYGIKGDTYQAQYSGTQLFDKNTANVLSANYNNDTLNYGGAERMWWIKCEKNTAYSFKKLLNSPYARNGVAETLVQPEIGVSVQNKINSASSEIINFTTSSTAEYLVWWAYNTSSTNITLQEELDSMQIVKGTYNASNFPAYEPYVGGQPSPSPTYPQNIDVVTGDNTITIANSDNSESQSYEVNLGDIELCKINTYQDEIFRNTNLLNTLDYSQNIDTSVSTNKIEINTTGDMVGVAYTFPLTQGKPYHFECDLDVGGNGVVVGIWREGGHNYTDEWIQADGHFSYDFTPDTASTQVMFYTEEEMISTATITNIYLGRGSEYIPYNEKGDWYLYKEIGKKVIDGTNTSFSYTNGVYFANSASFITYKSNELVFCNYFTFGGTATNTSGAYSNGNNKVSLHTEDHHSIYFRNDNLTSLSAWTTWLSTHNTIVYYVLATPTLEKITNEELLEDLNQVDLLNGLNNLTITSANLPAIMDLIALEKEV